MVAKLWLKNGKLVMCDGKVAYADECPCSVPQTRCVTSYLHFHIGIGEREWFQAYCSCDAVYSGASGVVGTPYADNWTGGVPSDFRLTVGAPQGGTVPIHFEFSMGHAPFGENPLSEFELHSVLIPTTSARPSLSLSSVSFSPHYSWADERYRVEYEEDCDDPFI